MKKTKQKAKRKRVNIWIISGISLVFLAILVFLKTFYPIIKVEKDYLINKLDKNKQTEILPTNTDFSLVIPKLRIASDIIKNVDPFNSYIYQQALTKGVAHAKGSGLPGEDKNIFIFSHSSVDFDKAIKYNSVFYLLNKLENGDEIIIYYQDIPYFYQVTEKQIVNPQRIEYIKGKTEAETLTLMTCWPPGSTLKRLLVKAERNFK